MVKAGSVSAPARVALVLLASLLVPTPSLLLADDRNDREACGQAIPGDVLAALQDMETEAKAAASKSNARAKAIVWAPSRGRQCHRYRGRRVCEGPRRVPLAGAGSEARARRLGLDPDKASATLLTGPPREEWVREAAEWDHAKERALAWPVLDSKLWRGFGPRRGSRRKGHDGLDIGAPEGAPVRAVADGLVAYSDNGVRGYGNMIMVVHGDGSVAFYAHHRANRVSAGDL
ncbi:MAG: M23 family metallopeptidase, partial [Myxococcales bacterium]|nr:M23 family metallopeptidase [Myxococcales bacterium]